MKKEAGAIFAQSRPHSVLLATNHLIGWSGSETLLLVLIEELRAQGCRLAVYARHVNREWAGRWISTDVPVFDDLAAMDAGFRFDLAHVHHNSCLIDVREFFPQLPILFSSLGVLPFLEQPPPFDCGVTYHLAISEEVAFNLSRCGVPQQQIQILRNLVSGRLFCPANEIRTKPERILVLSYKMDEGRKDLLREAAARIGASIRFVGEGGNVLSQHQLVGVINEADVVVSLGRGVIEAMLCGRIPLVFDIHGGDGLVTPETLNVIRTHNFSGRRHRIAFTVTGLVDEFGRYRQEYGKKLRELSLEQFGAESNIRCLLELYGNVIERGGPKQLSSYSRQLVEFCYGLGREDAKIRTSFENQLMTRNASLGAEIVRIKGTASWRITKPLRFLAFLWRAVIEKFRRNVAQ